MVFSRDFPGFITSTPSSGSGVVLNLLRSISPFILSGNLPNLIVFLLYIYNNQIGLQSGSDDGSGWRIRMTDPDDGSGWRIGWRIRMTDSDDGSGWRIRITDLDCNQDNFVHDGLKIDQDLPNALADNFSRDKIKKIISALCFFISSSRFIIINPYKYRSVVFFQIFSIYLLESDWLSTVFKLSKRFSRFDFIDAYSPSVTHKNLNISLTNR